MGRRIKIKESNKIGRGAYGDVYAVGNKAIKIFGGRGFHYHKGKIKNQSRMEKVIKEANRGISYC